MEKGVIVGSDHKQEWLIPWWLNNYKKHNSLPIIFFDFGLSEEAKIFCKKHGKLIPTKEEFDTDIKNTPEEYVRYWKIIHGNFLTKNSRPAWFRKPIACLHSPFDLSLWVDLDCEIKGNIESIFSYLTDHSEICIRKFISDKDFTDLDIDIKILNLLKPEIKEGEIIYNSGVIVFRKNAQIIQNWYDLCKKQSHLFHGDEDVLSRLIHEKNHEVSLLPIHFNVLEESEENYSTVIRHYHGRIGKIAIIEKIYNSPNQ